MLEERPGRRRALYPLLDAIVFIVIWQAVMTWTGVRFPFGVMQNFSAADYDAYIYVMTWMTLGLFVLSLVMHAVFAGSIGKLLTGVKTVRLNGNRLDLSQLLQRSAYMFLLGLLILAPGPLIAFFFGPGSEAASLLALGLGLLLLVLTTYAGRGEQSAVERWLGIKTVLRGSASQP